MRILITGGAGFIGSHLADYYFEKGNEITVLDNLSTGNLNNIKKIINDIDFVEDDIRNQNVVDKLISQSDLVLHMAAYLGVKNIMDNTLEAIECNYGGSEIVLKAAAKYGTRIILASSSEIYGKNSNQPLNEESDRVLGPPQITRWTYSDSKSLEEATAYFLNKKFDLPVTTARFFNTVGPRQTGQYGMVIPRFVQAALNNQNLLVYGDGSQSRVFCHVNDVVTAVDLLASSPHTIGQYFNVGGIGEITILDLAKKICEMTRSNSKIEFISYSDVFDYGFEDMRRRAPDISKISKAVGWKPKFNLKDVLEEVIAYYSK